MARMAYISLLVPANSLVNQPLRGRYLKVKDATTEFKLRIDNNETLIANKDFEIEESQDWKTLAFINETGADITIEFYYGDGTVKTNSVSLTGALELSTPTTRTHSVATVGTAAVELLPVNLDRKGWKVTNNGTETIYLGSDNGVTVNNGDPLAAGASTGWDDRDALYAISGTAGQNVRVAEVA